MNHELKTGDFQLPLYKQGTDLGGHLSTHEHPGLALTAYAEQLEAAAKMCRQLAVAIDLKDPPEIDADTHYIGVTGSKEWIDAQIAAGLLAESIFDEDEEDEDFDEEEDDENQKTK